MTSNNIDTTQLIFRYRERRARRDVSPFFFSRFGQPSVAPVVESVSSILFRCGRVSFTSSRYFVGFRGTSTKASTRVQTTTFSRTLGACKPPVTRRVEIMRICLSVCKLDPSQTNPKRDKCAPPPTTYAIPHTAHTTHHTPHTTHHTPHTTHHTLTHHTPHATHPTIGSSASARGTRATTPGGRRRSGWAVSKATCSGTNQTALHTIHHARHMTHHTPQNLLFGKRDGGKGYHSGGGQENQFLPRFLRFFFSLMS